MKPKETVKIINNISSPTRPPKGEKPKEKRVRHPIVNNIQTPDW